MTQAEYMMSVPVEIIEKFFGSPVDEILGNPGADKQRRDYPMGHSETFTEMLTRRCAGINAQHLLPHLQAGMTLLDLGCSPGSITAGLAQAVHPGMVWGVDFNQEQLQQARGKADALGLENLHYQKADGLNLPFPDNSFDAVHCHGFLMHSHSIREQMAEILRVLRPGGILGSRDMNIPNSFISPTPADNQEMWEMLASTVQQEGGDPPMGRHLKTFFQNAGLTGVESGFNLDSFTSREDVEFLAGVLTECGLSPEFKEMTSSSPEEFSRWRRAVERWRRHPGAVGCLNFGFALGWKP